MAEDDNCFEGELFQNPHRDHHTLGNEFRKIAIKRLRLANFVYRSCLCKFQGKPKLWGGGGTQTYDHIFRAYEILYIYVKFSKMRTK